MEMSKICFRFRKDMHNNSSDKWIGICYRVHKVFGYRVSLGRFPFRGSYSNATFSNQHFKILFIKRKIV
jgi:hypothetical protein